MEKEMNGIRWRHEWKYEINCGEMIALRQRLRAVMRQDPHCPEGSYSIRSLYFDTPGDKALREKIDGVNVRSKFRIRYYNGDTSFIRLEKKSKRDGLGSKCGCAVTAEEVRRILDGDTDFMTEDPDRPLLAEFGTRMRYEGLAPKTIVDYVREPFVFEPGNVRVTIDRGIRTGIRATDLLDPDCVTIPAGDAPILVEVKWDAYLPSIIRDIVQIPNRRAGAFSKYAQCRIYG